MFETVYVVHCRRLRARREYLQPILQALPWRVRWIDAYDPGKIPRRHLLGFRPGGRVLTVGEISVYLKHLEVFRCIASEGGETGGFVIEDDAIFPADFVAKLAGYRADLPAGFDFVFFGASCGLGESGGETARFTRHQQTRSMSGYLITPSACRRLVAELEDRPIREPIDLAVNRVIRARGLDVWWSEPPLLLNGSETGTFEHSLGLPWRQGSDRVGLSARVKRVFDRIVAAIACDG